MLTVALLDSAGNVIEGGAARVEVANGVYAYDLRADLLTEGLVYIRVVARDRPGNTTTMVKVWHSGQKKPKAAELEAGE
ncbi:MAG: hypothetical protein WBB45_16020 [Cyclobacteriaceae bacterium]